MKFQLIIPKLNDEVKSNIKQTIDDTRRTRNKRKLKDVKLEKNEKTKKYN